MKYRVLLVIALLLPTLFVLIVNPELYKKCISEDEAKLVFHKAEQLEAEGNIQDARHGYKLIQLLGCGSYPLQVKSNNSAARLQLVIDDAYQVSMNVINEFYVENKRYPESLDEIRSQIPQELIPAFNGFRYGKHDDGVVYIVTGLYGSKTFNLRK